MQVLDSMPRDQKEYVAMLLAEKARRSFLNYCTYMDKRYETPQHLKLICQKLDRVAEGKLKRLMLFLPPRHGKSETVSRKFPGYYLGKHPDHDIILSSYGFNLSSGFSRTVRDTIESRRYRTVFNLMTDAGNRAVDQWGLDDHRGGMLATGVGGATTGHGANLFIIDDPVKNQEEADSELIRDKVWDWWTSVVLTRLEPEAAIIFIMTRWHQDDLAGRILRQQKEQKKSDWDIVDMPALIENEKQRKKCILGRGVGQSLWKKRYDARHLKKKIKPQVGSRVWSALFQQNPLDPETQKFRRSWFQFYEKLPPESEMLMGYGCDTATSQRTAADFSGVVWGGLHTVDKRIYIEDVFLEKCSVTALARHICSQAEIRKCKRGYLEKNNAGEAIRQRVFEVARDEFQFRPPCTGVTTTTDKMVRAMEFQHLIENGTLRFKRGNSRIMNLIDHLCHFDGKGGDIDDDVDGLGFLIRAVSGKGSGVVMTVDDVI